MLTAINDYFRVNAMRTAQAFLVMTGLTLVGQVVLALQTLPKTTILVFVLTVIISELVFAFAIAIFLLLVGIIDVYRRIEPIARGAGLSIGDYVQSIEYQNRASGILKRTDKGPKWF